MNGSSNQPVEFYPSGFYNQEEKYQNSTNFVIETHMERLAEELEIKLSQHSLNLLQEEAATNRDAAATTLNQYNK